MWANGGKHYYVGELGQLTDGRYIIPSCWFRHESQGTVCADAWLVRWYPATNIYVINDPKTIEIKSTDLARNIYDILGDIPEQETINIGGRVPEGVYNGINPLRKVAQGKRIYTSFIKLWGDDVSGNRSKQYNAHTNVYFTHANLPHQKLAQQYHVKFSSTSQFATSGEQFDAAMADIAGDNTWHSAYDCSIQEDILLRIIPEVLPADNPQQSASCSHVGLHGNHPCRRCEFGGTERERETDEGYEHHFSPGIPRTAAQTLSAVHAQIHAAALGVAKAVTDMQTTSGVKDPLAEFWIQKLIPLAREQQQIRIRNPATRDPRLNPRRILNRPAIVAEIEGEIQQELIRWLITQPESNFESLPPDSPARLELRAGVHFSSLLCVDTLDVHRDTPVELLHTYLLGVEKYSWYHLHNNWTDPQTDLFAARLQSSSLNGLSLPALRASWMLQHPNNLIGKHLKALQQLTVFHLDDSLCDPLTFDLVKATGELGALLWFHEIEDLKQYEEDLSVLIGNLLDIWARIDPQRVFVKLKLHILLHILEDVRTHGPGILNSTEVFEAFNAVFRGSSIFSNHLAPSRDIADSSAVLESYKHIVSGGWWTSPDGTHLRAGYKVRRYFLDPQVTRQLGLEDEEDEPGYMHCLQKTRKHGAQTWASFKLENLEFRGLSPAPDSTWYPSQYIVSQHRDRCRIGSWVFANIAGRTTTGRITQLLTTAEGSDVQHLVVLKEYIIPSSPHSHFNMPELRRDQADTTNIVIPATNILFELNVQHNCRDSNCKASARQVVQQERQDSDIIRPAIHHTNDTLYLINTHALHHAALLRKALPRELTKPRPYISDRTAEHKRVATILRAAHDSRRTKDAAARRARKDKAALEAAVATTNDTIVSEVGAHEQQAAMTQTTSIEVAATSHTPAEVLHRTNMGLPQRTTTDAIAVRASMPTSSAPTGPAAASTSSMCAEWTSSSSAVGANIATEYRSSLAEPASSSAGSASPIGWLASGGGWPMGASACQTSANGWWASASAMPPSAGWLADRGGQSFPAQAGTPAGSSGIEPATGSGRWGAPGLHRETLGGLGLTKHHAV
ncbi:hypothetical protein BC628DRAFT_708876 [Trametes gibbosa]|nr:hypothetical protein BC628DRAFT_708876 [Trametes gibbosa]